MEASANPSGPTRDRNADQRRQDRIERREIVQRFADEIADWPSWRLRAAYAQPEAVRRAEEREARSAADRLSGERRT